MTGGRRRPAPALGPPADQDAVVRLRRPAADDGALLTPLWQDPRVMSFLGGPCDAAEAGDRLAGHLRHWEAYGHGLRVVEDEDGRVLGLAGLTRQEAATPTRPEAATPSGPAVGRGSGDAAAEDLWVSLLVYPHGWRRGYAAAALRELLHEGFTALDRSRLAAEVRLSHRRSRALLRQAGFVMRTLRHADGATWCRYVLTRETWAATTGRPAWVPTARRRTGDDALLAPLPHGPRGRRGRA